MSIPQAMERPALWMTEPVNTGRPRRGMYSGLSEGSCPLLSHKQIQISYIVHFSGLMEERLGTWLFNTICTCNSFFFFLSVKVFGLGKWAQLVTQWQVWPDFSFFFLIEMTSEQEWIGLFYAVVGFHSLTAILYFWAAACLARLTGLCASIKMLSRGYSRLEHYCSSSYDPASTFRLFWVSPWETNLVYWLKIEMPWS